MIALAVGAAAAVWVAGSAAAQGPTVAQIKAAIATHSDDFVLANAYGYDSHGHALGHGWIDVKTGAGRWVAGKHVSLRSVQPDTHDPTGVVVTDTNIDYTTRTWNRTKRVESVKIVRPHIVDPLTAAAEGVQFRLLGVENVNGRQTYHLRSTYYPYSGDAGARWDVWFSTDQDYLIRFTRTTRDGRVVQRIDNRWLPRTTANLALLTTAIPSGFKQVSVSP
jgi:hypothetical protein